MRFILLLLLGSCIIETFTDGESGTVYECDAQGMHYEYCADISGSELAEQVGGTCHKTDRLWPELTNALSNGCIYGCYPHSGCNAKNGCWCPQ